MVSSYNLKAELQNLKWLAQESEATRHFDLVFDIEIRLNLIFLAFCLKGQLHELEWLA